jgi:hypothetical protein
MLSNTKHAGTETWARFVIVKNSEKENVKEG